VVRFAAEYGKIFVLFLEAYPQISAGGFIAFAPPIEVRPWKRRPGTIGRLVALR
jgi:hypothetical protein